MPSARVLVVDDDPDIIEVLRIILESAGHVVTEAFGPKEAHQRLAVCAPDLILLDVMMPNESEGLVFLGRLRADYPSPVADTPVVILSAVYDTPRVRASARLPQDPGGLPQALPVQGFLGKPPEPSALLSMVESVLQQAAAI